MANSGDTIHLSGAALADHNHVCAFFHSQDEEYAALLPFIQEGVDRGERAFHIVDPRFKQDHRLRLQEAGMQVDELESRKQLEIRVWEQAYLRSGQFDQNDMLTLIQEVLNEGKTEGFPLTRLVAHMEWSLEQRAGVGDIMEYESRLNYVLPQFKDPVICVYDLAKFGAGTVIDILRTHPMVLLGGVLHVNPFYTSPDEFIKELHFRQNRTGSM